MRKVCWSAAVIALAFCSSLFAGTQTLRVSDPAAVRALVQAGGIVVADYESFSIIEIEQAPGKTLAASSVVEVLPDAGKILLNAGVVDTSAPETRTLRTVARAGKGRALHLVQFAGPVQKKWMDQLTASGFRVVDYIPENAYLVYGDTAALDALRAAGSQRSGLRWEGAYLPSDRIHPDVNTALAKYSAGDESANLFAVQMYKDKTANADTLMLIDALKTAPVVRDNRISRYRNVVVALQPDAIETLAGQPDVISIRPYVVPKKFDERQDMIVAGQLSGNGPSGSGYLNWLYSKGFTQDQFTASGFVVDVTDSGVDIGSTTPNHFGLYTSGNTAQASRVSYARLEGTANTGSSIQGCDGHGNINAHIIGGFNDLSGSPHADSLGYRYGLGVAPFVKVGSSVIFDPNDFTYPDYEDLISRAYRDGARISSDSWGADTYGGYDIDAQQYDALVRDAQPVGSAVVSNGNQEITIVFAAGNAGSGASTVGSPGTAKNVITVGAAENVHSHAITNGGASATGLDGCDTPDSEANSANDIATFSSRGPCSDGRIKPEIVAPGTHITGGVAQQIRAMTGTGNDLSCFDAGGVCGLQDDSSNYINFFPTNQQWYTTSSGTSHSTPALAGGCALIRQYFINRGWTIPSPAMVKAYLMNAARYMTGADANDDLWSNDQGMGMMNLGFAFDGTPRVLRDQESADKFTASGQSRTMSGLVVSNSKPFRVTLSWTDAPGSTSGNSYNNNLDLTVVAGGVTYKGNVFSGADSASGGTADAKNNTESVFLPAGTTGAVVVTVSAANINSDGVPNDGDALDQDYALVVYNFEEVAMPVIAGAGSALAGETCGVATNGAIDPDELVTVKFALQNVGSADTTNVVATLQASGGVTLPSGAQSYGALLAGGAAVTNSFTFTATGECGGVLSATLTLQDGATDLGSIGFNFTLGSSIGATVTNLNASSITLTDNSAASPYPGTISVAGLAGTISKVTVTLNGFSHAYPEDMDIILVSPDGDKVCLMGAVGGGISVSGLTLTFDDDAAGAVPTPIVSGTYLPGGSPWTLPAPAPADPYATTLAEFNGGNPNGTWSLYAADQYAGDSGTISGGWKISVTASEPLCCGSNKPPVLSPVGSKSIIESNLLEFTVIATDNYDGDPITLVASNVPSGASFLAAQGTGTFSWASPAPTGTYSVTFNASDKDGFDEETISITVNPTPYVDTNCAVLISEYVEGSSNNKALEIYNPGVDALDLTAGSYVVQIYANGAGIPSSSVTLAGVIPSQDVFVLVNSSAGAALLAMADQTSGSLGFNGNDAVVLRSGGASGPILDVIGVVGTDPGTEWGSGTESTADNTLRRRTFVTRGDTNEVDAFIPSAEWAGYAVDTFDGLGTHTSDCTGPAVPTPPVLNAIGNKSVQLSGTLSFEVTATQTEGDTVTITASNLPAGASFYPTNEAGTFVWANASPTGTYSVTFNAADDDGFDEETITITVSESGGGGDCGVIISEYVEGSSNNKVLEIYNGTASSVDLLADTYVVMGYQNGGTSASYTIPLTGTVSASATFVLANSASTSSVLAIANQTSGALTFNGNDAVVLRSGGASGPVVDSIGVVGTDPGAAGWGTDPANTTDNTIRRKSSVTTGDTNTVDAFDPATEWDGYALNTFDGLGSHTMDCGGGEPIPPDLGSNSMFNAASGEMVLFWDNSGGGTYRVMFATNLLDNPAFIRVIATNVSVNAYTSPIEAEAMGAYRVEQE